jgi:hypothetical protein
MKIRLLPAICVLASGGLAFENALAADEIAPLPRLDTCIAAALQQRPGMLFGWRSLNDPSDGSYSITILTPDGKIADAICSSNATTDLRFENRVGQRRFEYYKRMSVPEATARSTAPLIFAGTVRIISMEIDTDVKGSLRYEYRMLLQSGHRAMSQVDAISGLLTYVEAKE